MALVGDARVVEGSQNSAEIENLARFAVQEHNKKENSALEFVRVISAKEQVVAGTVYYIILEAKDGDNKQIYEAKIWEKPWLNFRELQEFKLLAGAAADDDGDNAPSVSATT